MGLSEKMTEIKSECDALITYANGVTGEANASVGDCIASLVAGYGGGGLPLNVLGFDYGTFSVESETSSSITSGNINISHRLGAKPNFCCVFLPPSYSDEDVGNTVENIDNGKIKNAITQYTSLLSVRIFNPVDKQYKPMSVDGAYALRASDTMATGNPSSVTETWRSGNYASADTNAYRGITSADAEKIVFSCSTNTPIIPNKEYKYIALELSDFSI